MEAGEGKFDDSMATEIDKGGHWPARSERAHFDEILHVHVTKEQELKVLRKIDYLYYILYISVCMSVNLELVFYP
jgi:hypothetical protein